MAFVNKPPASKPRPITAEESRELAGHFNAIANAAIAAATFMGEHAFPVARIDDARSIADRARHAAGELEAWAKHLDQGWRPL